MRTAQDGSLEFAVWFRMTNIRFLINCDKQRHEDKGVNLALCERITQPLSYTKYIFCFMYSRLLPLAYFAPN